MDGKIKDKSKKIKVSPLDPLLGGVRGGF